MQYKIWNQISRKMSSESPYFTDLNFRENILRLIKSTSSRKFPYGSQYFRLNINNSQYYEKKKQQTSHI